MTVGPDQPGVGCAATPRGLSTTTMSSSSYSTTRPSTSRGGSAGRGGGSVTCSGSPASTRSDLAAVRPSRSTRPSPISSAALDLDSPNILAMAASSRSPSRPSGTASSRPPGAVIARRPPSGARPSQGRPSTSTPDYLVPDNPVPDYQIPD